MSVLVAGGGIGGLAAALAVSQAGVDVQLFEKAPAFSEVGAGVQLGPNVVKVLHGWGLADALDAVAARPLQLQVKSALTGKLLSGLRLGETIAARYGAPYLTVHRSDLHAVLLAAVRKRAGIKLHLNRPLLGFSQNAQAVSLKTFDDLEVEGDALIAADGLWSAVRQQLLGDGLPRATGHLAYRALVPQLSLPVQLRSQDVTVWLGPKMHVVQYPVRRGEWLNVVVIVQGDAKSKPESWNHAASTADLSTAMAGSHAGLLEMVHAADHWRLWTLHDRAPLQGAAQHALGRVALLGDAAHPMLPYLAQGAGMAIEDAACLGDMLHGYGTSSPDMPARLQQYALGRWQRNAKVQAKAARNGQIFHAQGFMRVARDVSMKLMGEKLLDMPWLYGQLATA